MKLKINDQVIVTSGKDRGKKSQVVAVLPKKNQVVVAGANIYTKHVRKMQGRTGEMVKKERPLDVAKVAILNEKGQPDRVGYQIVDGQKVRIYKKTHTVIVEQAKVGNAEKAPKATEKTKKSEKKIEK